MHRKGRNLLFINCDLRIIIVILLRRSVCSPIFLSTVLFFVGFGGFLFALSLLIFMCVCGYEMANTGRVIPPGTFPMGMLLSILTHMSHTQACFLVVPNWMSGGGSGV